MTSNTSTDASLAALLAAIRSCTTCDKFLAHGVNPVLSASPTSRLLIVGQAPGRIVHGTSIPWSDKSGENLRSWMGVDDYTFYNEAKVGIVPMGFCYPGKGSSGDLPPRRECAPLWHQQLMDHLPNLKLILLIGSYAQKYYLAKDRKSNLTETVQSYEDYLPLYFPLPHPSGRNNIWQAKHPWFKEKVLPRLKKEVQKALEATD